MIAGGGAGTLFTFGYVIYIVVGVIGVAVSSLFYHYPIVAAGAMSVSTIKVVVLNSLRLNRSRATKT